MALTRQWFGSIYCSIPKITTEDLIGKSFFASQMQPSIGVLRYCSDDWKCQILSLAPTVLILTIGDAAITGILVLFGSSEMVGVIDAVLVEFG